jgi:TatD DNase family protein
MALIDTHLHLDLFKDDVSIASLIELNKIYSIAVTNTPSVFTHTQNIVAHSKYLRAALGLHPELASKRENELFLFKSLIKETKYIGEVGLDYSSRNISEIEIQNRIFKQILQWCELEGDKILSIHSRKAEKETLDSIGKSFDGKVILHYYSGSLMELKRALSYGCYFSINYAMTKTIKGREIIKNIPVQRLLTESDAPFINHTKSIVEQISETTANIGIILNFPKETIQEIIYNNFKRFLSS